MILGILANVAVLAGAFVLSLVADVPWWTVLVAAGAVLLVASLLARRPLRRRYVTLKLLEEVSSSRCGDYYVRLAELSFRELRPETAMRRLTELRLSASIRTVASSTTSRA